MALGALARRPTPWILALLGVALVVALLIVARPAAVLALLGQTRWQGLALAGGWAVVVAVLRGWRLAVVLGAPLTPVRATQVMAVGQMAVMLLPLRLGDLSLVPLLELAGVSGKLRILSYLVTLRLLDITAVLAWAVATAGLLGRSLTLIAAPLALAPIVALGATALGLRGLRRVAGRWRTAGGWRRVLLAQLLQVRRELRVASHSPWRGLAAVALSLGIWGGIWGLTVALLRAMGLQWSASVVLLGVIGAAVGSSLPATAVGSFGGLEAGWTAALASAGVPASGALAAGFATHLWSVVFAAALGLAGAVALAVSPAGRIASVSRSSAATPTS